MYLLDYGIHQSCNIHQWLCYNVTSIKVYVAMWNTTMFLACYNVYQSLCSIVTFKGFVTLR